MRDEQSVHARKPQNHHCLRGALADNRKASVVEVFQLDSDPRYHTASMSEQSATIALNKRARFEYHLDERFEAGIELRGWEVKALRAGRVQFGDSYVLLKNGEAFLFGCLVTPLSAASSHVNADPTRTRRLLMHRREIDHLIGMVERKGQTVIPTAMYWKQGRVKVEIAVARGKKLHDKRKTEKDRDWERQKARLMRK